MKQLLIIRHAKSSWAQPGQPDFDRPLNDRGKKDAQMMPKRLLENKISIDLFIASTANRAFSTACFFADAYGVPQNKIDQQKKLYHASPPIFFEVVHAIADEMGTAAIFSHNPGITEFINELTLTKVDNMPTCGIFAVRADISSWKDFANAKKEFWFFDYPKL